LAIRWALQQLLRPYCASEGDFLPWLGLRQYASESKRAMSSLGAMLQGSFAACRSRRGALCALLLSSLTTLWLWFFMPPFGVLAEGRLFWLSGFRADNELIVATLLALVIARKEERC
jgi:hypothetical protein